MVEALIGLAGLILGGIGLEMYKRFMDRKQNRDTTAAALRTELRLELATMRTEMERLKKEAHAADKESDTWRNRYYYLLASAARGDKDAIEKLMNIVSPE